VRVGSEVDDDLANRAIEGTTVHGVVFDDRFAGVFADVQEVVE
jgi:hypothetical protein